jgi:methionine-rich copper-binding protein CopC
MGRLTTVLLLAALTVLVTVQGGAWAHAVVLDDDAAAASAVAENPGVAIPPVRLSQPVALRAVVFEETTPPHGRTDANDVFRPPSLAGS